MDRKAEEEANGSAIRDDDNAGRSLVFALAGVFVIIAAVAPSRPRYAGSVWRSSVYMGLRRQWRNFKIITKSNPMRITNCGEGHEVGAGQ